MFLQVLFLSTLIFADAKITTFAYWDKPDVDLWYSLPKEINKDTKVLFVIHGASRDVKRYYRAAYKEAKDKNVILVVPHFKKEDLRYYYTLGMSTNDGEIISNDNKHLTSSISSFYKYFQSKYQLYQKSYLIYGFSGGSQFVHRYMMYGDDQAIEKAAIGSAGWYTFINSEPFPYGIKNKPIDKDRMARFMSREVLFLLGEEDNSPNHSSLNSSKGAMNQGNNRLERGIRYFQNLTKVSEKLELSFRWRYKLVKGLDHDTYGMTENALPFLLSDQDYEN